MAKALHEAVLKRVYQGVYVCMKCNALHRSGKQKPKLVCRKCGSTRFRPKKKDRK